MYQKKKKILSEYIVIYICLLFNQKSKIKIINKYNLYYKNKPSFVRFIII